MKRFEIYDRIIKGINIVGNASNKEIDDYEKMISKQSLEITKEDMTPIKMAELKFVRSNIEGKNYLNEAEIVCLLKKLETRIDQMNETFLQLAGDVYELRTQTNE